MPVFLADERRIQQVLDNLLSNALRFSPEGGEIRVEALPYRSDQRAASRSRNHGSRMMAPASRRQKSRMFSNIFIKARIKRLKGQQGTGLGLAIARHIVEAHKGRIWAESEIGCGVDLPCPFTDPFGCRY